MVKCLECREYSRVVGFSPISFQKLGQNISIKFPRTEFLSPKDKFDSSLHLPLLKPSAVQKTSCDYPKADLKVYISCDDEEESQ